ncbi:AlbA family DNA-binding domain-containing protein [Geminisphaera colitermitum]|uniref:AlbA family DNA-binding domain-containing protein n=1 Tax=Geminisphaera colitermitum TaxID=1148786 RepID=UPI000158C87A|nr:ATP-binding protein [Geminisphaera colitermitum]
MEFKKSTAQLSRVGETLSGFLNTGGGRVLIGVTPSGRAVGQQVSDTTLQDIASMIARIEPAMQVSLERVPVPGQPGCEVIILSAQGLAEQGPFLEHFRFNLSQDLRDHAETQRRRENPCY